MFDEHLAYRWYFFIRPSTLVDGEKSKLFDSEFAHNYLIRFFSEKNIVSSEFCRGSFVCILFKIFY